jgi:hypothetical protein
MRNGPAVPYSLTDEEVDLARQHAPEMLQCVAVPPGTGKSHLL